MLLNLSRDIMIPFSLLKYRKIKMTKEGENLATSENTDQIKGESRIQLGMSIDENGRPQFLSGRSEEEVRKEIPQIPWNIIFESPNDSLRKFLCSIFREEIALFEYDFRRSIIEDGQLEGKKESRFVNDSDLFWLFTCNP